MGPVEDAIRASIHEGQVLRTPTGRGNFTVKSIGIDTVVLLLGKQQAWTSFTWACLEGIPDFLRGRDWVKIGSVFGEADDGTLDAYLKTFLARATAGWVAVVLEVAGVVEIDRGRPARARLAAHA